MKQALEHHIMAGHESDWTLGAGAGARAPRPEPADFISLTEKREEQPSSQAQEVYFHLLRRVRRLRIGIYDRI